MITPRSTIVLLFLTFILTTSVLPSAESPAPVRFSEHLIQGDYGYAFGIAAADLDGDGDIDLTSVDTVNNAIYWFENDGKGKFKRHTIAKDETGWLERHAIGDIDGDGKPDIVCVKNQSAEIVWFRNNGTPRDDKPWQKFVLAEKFPRSYDVVLADLDGDGKLDVAASAWVGQQFAWFRNDGKVLDGKLWPRYQIDEKTGGETRTIRAGDFNRDGKIDLLGTITTADTIAWYENPGEAGKPWKKHIVDNKAVRPAHGHPVDLDGDGDLDIVMALGFNTGPEVGEIVWYENVGKPGDGTTWKKHVLAKLPGAFEAIAADVDGDGKFDIIASAWSGPGGGRVVWLQNPGDMRKEWPMHVLKAGWTRANQVITADLNGDKRLDIIGCAERGSNEVRWWRNEGK
jgi:hypothetical protein